MSEPEGRKRSAIDLLQEVVHLREVNRDLLAALERIVAARDIYHGGDLKRAVDAAKPAIDKAKE